MRTLYVEDNELDADLMRRALARAHPPIQLDVATTIAEAMTTLAASADKYDAVLFDLSLPDGDGLEVLKHIRDRQLPLITIAVTGTGDERSVMRALKLGVDDYLIKQRGYLAELEPMLRDAKGRAHFGARHQSLRVLYAENDPRDGDLVTRAIAANAPHIKIDVVSDAPDVLRRLASGVNYDVLLLDYRLDTIDALELIKQIRRSNISDLPIVVVTALGSEEVAAQALRLGVADYIVKDDVYLQRLPTILEFAHTKAKLQAMQVQEIFLQASRLAAEKANIAKGDFLASMSHEIRTPMNGILGLLFMLEKTDLSAAQRDYLTRAEESAQYLLSIINDILDFSKIEAGKMELEPMCFRLDRLLDHCRTMLLAQAEQKGLTFDISVDADVPLVLHADAKRLQQVLLNLCSNSIKFTHEGGVSIRVSVRSRRNDWVEIQFAIKDTGIGLTAEQQQRIFEPYGQADASIHRRYGGTGLGLVISKQYVELMGGQLSVVSQRNNGCEFQFFAQFELTADPLIDDGSVYANNEEALHQRGAAVLIVEDNPLNQEIAQMYLQHLGMRVEICDSGQAAIDAVSSQPRAYDLILMDVQMPGIDGCEAASAIRKLSGVPAIPIVAMTADVLPASRERCLQAGMNDFLPKPIRIHELAQMLAKWTPASSWPN